MSRAFSPKSFLRHTSNALLARYFRERRILGNVDFEKIPEQKVDPIFDAWHLLPDEERRRVDSDFREVDSLAHEDGERTLLDEARFHGVDLAEAFAALDGFHDRALFVFLELPRAFEVALRFNDSDRSLKRYWRKRKGLPRVTAAVDEECRHRLATALSSHFRRNEGRGFACTVEVYKRDIRDYFFAFPEDYGAVRMEYAGGQLERRRLHPAFEIIFVYTADKGTLDLFFDGDRKAATELQAIFASEILRTVLEDAPGADKVFELNKLKRRGFRFRYDVASGIRDVRIKKIRFTTAGAKKDRVTLEVDPTTSRTAIYDAMDRNFQSDQEPASSTCSKMPLSLMNITQVGITVTFANDGRRGRQSRTFDISYPNACPLDHEGRDGAIRQMLIDSGIEPWFDESAAIT